MKKIYALLFLIITITISAQAPQGFNYQATVRNNTGTLIINKSVTFKFNVIPTSASGTAAYSETQTVTTDDVGQVSLVIGRGTATTGTFASIDWSTGTYFLGIELNTGNGFIAMGTTQLLSVPYAMFAKNSDKASSIVNMPKKFRLEYISGDGQIYSGGGMHSPMIFKIFNITDNTYITSLTQEGLSLKSNANIGYEDGPFYMSSTNYCDSCFGGYYYIPPPSGLPARPFNLIVTVTMKYSNTGEVIDRYIINQYIR